MLCRVEVVGEYALPRSYWKVTKEIFKWNEVSIKEANSKSNITKRFESQQKFLIYIYIYILIIIIIIINILWAMSQKMWYGYEFFNLKSW